MTGIAQNARIVGSLRRTEDGKGAVRMEDVYDTDIDDLWSALTDPRRLARWMAEVEGELRLGGQFYAKFTSSVEGAGRIDACQAPRRLVVTLSPGRPDETIIEATLAPELGKTRLIIVERGLPLDELADHGAGWQAIVEDLTAHIHRRRPGDWRTRWIELMPAYQDLAGDLA